MLEPGMLVVYLFVLITPYLSIDCVIYETTILPLQGFVFLL